VNICNKIIKEILISILFFNNIMPVLVCWIYGVVPRFDKGKGYKNAPVSKI